MPGLLLTQGLTAFCPHSGNLQVISQLTRVKLSGKAVLLQNDSGTVSGCPFQVPAGAVTKPQPCVRVTFLSGATRVRASGQPVLLQDTIGLCHSVEQIPQGPPKFLGHQTRVRGT